MKSLIDKIKPINNIVFSILETYPQIQARIIYEEIKQQKPILVKSGFKSFTKKLVHIPEIRIIKITGKPNKYEIKK